MVSEVLSLVGRNAGRFRFLQATVTVRTDDLEKAHSASETIASNIRDQVPHVERVAIQCEPQAREYLHIAVPLADVEGRLSPHFGESPFFALARLRLRDRRIEAQEIVENPYTHLEKGKGIRVAEWLVENKVDYVAFKEEIKHKGPGYVFSNAGVTTHVVSNEDLEGALSSIRSRLSAPSPQKLS